MRKWKCKRIKALLEGEPLIVFTEYEDDNENGFYSPTFNRGFKKSHLDILMDELKFRSNGFELEGIDICDYDEYDCYWMDDEIKWYETEEFLYGKKMENKKIKKRSHS